MTFFGHMHRLRALMLAGVLLLAIAAGLQLTGLGPGGRTGLNGNPVAASSRDTFTVEQPQVLLRGPGLVLQRGTLSLIRGRDSSFGATVAPEEILAKGKAHLVLEGARFVLDPGPGSHSKGGGLVVPANLNPFLSSLAMLGFETLTVRNCVIIIKRAQSEETLENVNVELTASQGGALKAKGTALHKGQTLDFDATLGPQRRETSGVQQNLKAKVANQLIDVTIDGRLTLGERLAISATRAELDLKGIRAAAQWLGVAWPAGPGFLDFKAKGPLEWSDGNLSFERAKFDIDGNAASGGLALSLTGGRPIITGTLAFEEFDAAPYIAPASGSGTLLSGSGWPSLSSLLTGSSGSILTEIEADLRISAAHVSLEGTALGSGAISAVVKDRILRAEITELKLEDGSSGQGRLDVLMPGNTPEIKLRGQLDGFDVAPVATALFGYPALAGRALIDADLSASGFSSFDVLSTTSGTVALSMNGGGSFGADLASLFASVKQKPQDGWGASTRGQTAFDTLGATFKIEHGTLTAQSLTAATRAGQISATGTINAADKTINGTVRSINPPPLDGVGGGAAEAIDLLGAWSMPSIRARSPPRLSADAVAP